ncbi:hypothetical protein [Gorillibacterium sp. sgz5001074]|uniref:hypothetical protein n=1 Tax=Gorillibacterium sp. sgz5001074 TaxID=3446695 RepID=UPI003F663FCA
MAAAKLYIARDKDEWSVTDKMTRERASIKHLEELVRTGEKPFIQSVDVEEGSYKWNAEQQKYIRIENGAKANEVSEKNNVVAQIINMFGYISIVISLLVGFFGSDNITLSIIYIVSGLFSGFMLIGFGEIIRLLDVIAKK